MTVVVHKDEGSPCRIYFFNSQNMPFLEQAEAGLPTLMRDRLEFRKQLGLKDHSPYYIKTSYQHWIDLRAFLRKCVRLFTTRDATFAQLYTNAFVHNCFRWFDTRKCAMFPGMASFVKRPHWTEPETKDIEEDDQKLMTYHGYSEVRVIGDEYDWVG